MLTKILFTILVIVGVLVFFRYKQGLGPRDAKRKTAQNDEQPGSSLPTRTIAYLMLGLLIALSALIFVFHYHEENRIVNIRVTSQSGESIHYQTRHKTIEGRQFTTLDGTLVTLGENDRIEMIEQ